MTPSPPASSEDRTGLAPEAGAGAPPDVPPCTDETLDVRGLMCPLPVLKARKALKRLAPGTTLEVLATDPASVIDFKHFCETTPFALQAWREEAGVYAFRIRTPG